MPEFESGRDLAFSRGVGANFQQKRIANFVELFLVDQIDFLRSPKSL